jgi:hypothetical protein
LHNVPRTRPSPLFILKIPTPRGDRKGAGIGSSDNLEVSKPRCSRPIRGAWTCQSSIR